MDTTNLDFELLSLNVRGLNEEKKRRSIFRWIKQLSVDVCLLQETYSTPEVENLWKNEWRGRIVYSHGTNHARGVAILIKPDLDIDIENIFCDDSGRIIILSAKIQNTDCNIINIYSPNDEKSQCHFFRFVRKVMKTFKNKETDNDKPVIMGGDFNYIIEPSKDRKGGAQIQNSKTRSEMTKVINSLKLQWNLQDIWRVKNPKKKRYTWQTKSGSVKSRLDYWLTSQALQDQITKVDIIPALKTDHSAIILKITGSSHEEKGKGFWKMNNSYLDEETYVKHLLEHKDNWLTETKDIDDPRVVWEYIKYKIREFSIKYSKQRARERNQSEKLLRSQLHSLEEALDTADKAEDENKLKEQINQVQGELEAVDSYKTQGLILRSRCRWHEKGEKSNQYFLRMESRNKAIKKQSKLCRQDGTYTTNSKEILQMQAHFYEDLYKEKPIEMDKISQYLKNVETPCLSEEEKEACEGLLTIEECAKVLKTLKNGRSPGNDGITVEFYKKYWPVFGGLLVKSLNYSYVQGELSSSQKQAVITLIDKGKDRTQLKNWRPISLLNVDYKIATKTLAKRITPLLPTLIHHNQVGYVQGRNILDNIRTIDDILKYTKAANIPGILLCIDFKKAFDSLSWKFVEAVLKKFNFGVSFVQWFKTMYQGAVSCVVNNGNTSHYFSLGRGVRQGDPLSPYLFVLAAEILACKIRDNTSIHGLSINNTEVKTLQYADDTSGILKDLASAKIFMKTVEQFGSVSGLELNKEKTEGLWLGSDRENTSKPLGIQWSETPLRILGVYFSYNEVECNKLNYEQRLEKARHILNLWRSRNLTILGRILIIKCFIISQFLFTLSAIDIPEKYIKEINSMIFKFIWNGKRDRIKRSVLVKETESGGLRAPDFRSMILAARAKWVTKLMSTDNHVWKDWFRGMLRKEGIEVDVILYSNYNIRNIVSRPYKSNFHVQVLEAWNKISQTSPVKKEHFIWYNKDIKINKKEVFFKELFEAGLLYVHDLFDDDKKLRSFGFWADRGVPAAKYLSWAGIVSATKTLAKQIDKDMDTGTQILGVDTPKGLTKYDALSTKLVYSQMLSSQYGVSLCIPGISKYFENPMNVDWEAAFRRASIMPKDTKTKVFQYKFLHDILCNNSQLCRWKIKNSDVCDFCNANTETTLHLFWECGFVKKLWEDLAIDYKELLKNVLINFETVFLGVDIEPACTLIYQAKRFIYKCKYQEKQPMFYEFKNYIGFIIEIERQIAMNNNKDCKWIQK